MILFLFNLEELQVVTCMRSSMLNSVRSVGFSFDWATLGIKRDTMQKKRAMKKLLIGNPILL
jgi:hypothetical protein